MGALHSLSLSREKEDDREGVESTYKNNSNNDKPETVTETSKTNSIV